MADEIAVHNRLSQEEQNENGFAVAAVAVTVPDLIS